MTALPDGLGAVALAKATLEGQHAAVLGHATEQEQTGCLPDCRRWSSERQSQRPMERPRTCTLSPICSCAMVFCTVRGSDWPGASASCTVVVASPAQQKAWIALWQKSAR